MCLAVSKKLVLAGLFLALSSCSGGGDNDKTGPSPSGGGTDFNTKINAKDCRDPFIFVNDWQEELGSQIGTGDAACVKAAIERGARVDQSIDDFFDGPTLPVFLALDKSSLWFTKNKYQAFATLKVLVDAGADLNVKNAQGQTPLFMLLSSPELLKDFPTVPLYIAQTGKVNLDETDAQGDTVLHKSIRLKETELAKALVVGGADPELKSRSGALPLMLAFDSQLEDLATFLIDRPVSIDVTDSRGNRALHRAVQLGYEKLALNLTGKMSVKHLNHQNAQGETALYISIARQLPKIAKALLAKGADADLRTTDSSPIHLALAGDQAELALQLVQKIKVLEGKDQRGDTPLVLATKQNNLSAMKALLQRGAGVATATDDGRTPLHLAQSLPAAEILVSAGAPVDSLSQNGYSPLAEAVRRSKREVVSYLIAQKADPKWVGPDGKTLLHLAIANDDTRLAGLLFEQNLPVNAADASGASPLFSARSLRSIDLLSSKGANLDQPNQAGTTVLEMHVVDYLAQPSVERLKLIERLVQLGANVDEVTARGHSLLQLTVKSVPLLSSDPSPAFYEELLPILVAKAQVDKVNAEGNSAFHYVDRVEEVQLLHQHRADPNIKNREGLTPLAVKVARDSGLKSEEAAIQSIIEQLSKQLEEAQDEGDRHKAERIQKDLDRQKAGAETIAKIRAELGKVIAEIKNIGGEV